MLPDDSEPVRTIRGGSVPRPARHRVCRDEGPREETEERETEDMHRLTRRHFGAAAAAALAAGPVGATAARANRRPPSYLHAYAERYAADPRGAARQWFTDARFGLFVHWSLRAYPPDQRRIEHFRGDGFDAAALADLAVAAEMRYVNFTVYHGGGPSMWKTARSPANTHELIGRDLLGELAEACAARRLGLFCYIHVSLIRSHDGRWERNRTAYRELLANYGPLAGMWFDSVLDYYRHPHYHPHLAEQYALIRRLQPQALLSFKQGALGCEDFLAPEHYPRPPETNRGLPPEVRARLRGAPTEICTTLQVDPQTGSGAQQWMDRPDARHRDADEVAALLAEARQYPANLLLNTGLRADGSIHPTDAATLREVGRRIRESGWPGER